MKKETESKTGQLRLYNEIVDHISEGVFLILPVENTILYANPAVERMFGYDSGELDGKPITLINDPLSRNVKDWSGEILQALKKDGIWYGEIQHIKKNGTIFWTQVNVTEFEHQNHGNIWIAIHRDITERIQTARLISESEERFRALFEAAPDAIFLAEPESGKILDANQSACRLLLRAHEEIIGMHQSELHPAEKKECSEALFAKHIHQSMQLGYTLPTQNFIVRSDGAQIAVEISAQIIKVHEQNLLIGIFRDITERNRAYARLHSSEERYRRLVEGTPDVVYTFSLVRGGTYYSPHVQEVLGYSPEHLCENPFLWNQSIHPDDEPLVKEAILTFETKRKFDIEYRIRHANGSWVWLRDRSIGRNILDGEMLIEGIATDITARKISEHALRESEARYRALVENQPDLICRWLPDTTLTFINQAYCDFFGKKREELLGTRWIVLISKIKQDEIRTHYEELAKSPVAFAYEHEAINASGEKRWQAWRDIPVFDESGQLLEFQSIGRDVTEQKQADDILRDANQSLKSRLEEIQSLQETLRYQAMRDSLTGLFNRRYLYETLERELVRARRENYPLGIIMMDIDHFKEFNDTYGHQAGDEVLKSLGVLLHTCIRQGDIACRYGGEEFLLVLPGADINNAKERADTMRKKFEQMRVGYNEIELHATISVGVAYSPRHGSTTGQVIKAADDALYKAKQAGRNCVYVWDGAVGD